MVGHKKLVERLFIPAHKVALERKDLYFVHSQQYELFITIALNRLLLL